MEEIKNIIESLLFVAEAPLNLDHFKKAIPEAETRAIKNAIQTLKEEYESRNGGFFIHEVAGGYQFRTKPDYKEWIRRMFQPKPPKLSKPSMETLAIIAYRQPVLRSEIEHIRGVNSGNSIRLLLERKLVRVLGRREIPGRPLVYATTNKFLETFDLKDLKDLPSLKEIGDLENNSPKPRQQEIIFHDGDDENESDDIGDTDDGSATDGENNSQGVNDHEGESDTPGNNLDNNT
ncbi:MAG: SMC-Scp complex subunit ScpB [Dissulfuribacterales bacterium]